MQYVPSTDGSFQDPTGSNGSVSVFSPETLQISQEEPWDKSGEDLIRNWDNIAQQQASDHRARGFFLKKLYKIFGIISILTAGVVFLVSNITISPHHDIDTLIKVIIAFINLVVANLVNFLDYGPKYQKQFEYEAKYTKLSIDIQEILAIDREFRSPKDRTLAEYKEKVGNLFSTAPEV